MPIGAEPKRKGWRAARARVSFQLCKRLRVNRRLSVELDAPVVSCLKEINMATIYHQVWINAPLAKVYEAISTLEGIVSWWGPHKSTKTDIGLVLEHDPGPAHGVVRFKVLDTVQDKRVEWEFISTHPKSSLLRLGPVRMSFGRSQREIMS